jgi:N-acetylglucosamine kinase-like BadF-type ATPase
LEIRSVKIFLGVDGGGTKTDFLLIEETGRVVAAHRGGPAYHLEIGLDALQAMLVSGIRSVLRQAGLSAAQLEFAVIGLPTARTAPCSRACTISPPRSCRVSATSATMT